MDEAAEKAAILAALVDPSRIREMLEKGLSQKTFGNPLYRDAWRVLATLYLSGKEISPLSLESEAARAWPRIAPLLQEAHRLGQINWEDFLPSLKTHEALRGIGDVVQKCKEWGTKDPAGVQRWLPTLIHMLSSVAQESQLIDPRPSSIYQDGTYGEPVATGLKVLDDQLHGGYRASELLVFGAPSGHGKTALGASLAAYAIANEIPTLIFSLEMDQYFMLCRVLCAYANVSWVEAVSKKGFDEHADERLAGALRCANDYLRIYPPTVRAPEDIDARISWHATEFGRVGLVIVDHIGLVEGKDLNSTRLNPAAYIGRMAYGLKNSAAKRKTTVVTFSQLSEEQSREFKKKKDLLNVTYKGSGDIFNAADFGFIFMRHPDELNVGFFRKKKDRLTGDLRQARFDVPHLPQYYLFANDGSHASGEPEEPDRSNP